MSKKTRRRLDAALKANIAPEALRHEATVAEIGKFRSFVSVNERKQ